jgi:hypothetical protein
MKKNASRVPEHSTDQSGMERPQCLPSVRFVQTMLPRSLDPADQDTLNT